MSALLPAMGRTARVSSRTAGKTARDGGYMVAAGVVVDYLNSRFDAGLTGVALAVAMGGIATVLLLAHRVVRTALGYDPIEGTVIIGEPPGDGGDR